MKFSTKLIASFTGITLLLISIGGISQYLNNEVKDRIFKESEKAVHKLNLSGEMGLQLYKSLINVHYLLEHSYRKNLSDNKEKAEINTRNAEQRIKNAISSFTEQYHRFEQAVSEDSGDGGQHPDPEVLDKLKSRFNIYSSLVNELLTLMRQDQGDGKEFFTITIEPFFRNNLLPLVDRLRDQTQQDLDQEIAFLNTKLSEAGTYLFLATGGSLLLSILLIILLYRSVAHPLNDLATAAQHIGSGNLDERIQIDSNDELGDLAAEFNSMAENLSKITVSKNIVDDIIDSMEEALIVTDREGRIRRVNGSATGMLGYTEVEMLGTALADLFPDEVAVNDRWEDQEAVKNGESSLSTKDGSDIPVSYSIASIHNSQGERQGNVCVASDITQRREAEAQIRNSLKEKEILLAEIHHRVKNNLAVISGLLQMQIWETNHEEARVALKDSQLRVQSIALIHEKLYTSDKLSYIQLDRYLGDLVKAIQKTYGKAEENIEINTDLQPVVLNINQAIPCSLLLNELMVNAYKYAFRSNKSGIISIRLHGKGEGEEVMLEVVDDGIGLPENFEKEKSSLGMSLIRTLVNQLNGNLEIQNDKGTSFVIRFKAEEVA